MCFDGSAMTEWLQMTAVITRCMFWRMNGLWRVNTDCSFAEVAPCRLRVQIRSLSEIKTVRLASRPPRTRRLARLSRAEGLLRDTDEKNPRSVHSQPITTDERGRCTTLRC